MTDANDSTDALGFLPFFHNFQELDRLADAIEGVRSFPFVDARDSTEGDDTPFCGFESSAEEEPLTNRLNEREVFLATAAIEDGRRSL